MSNAGAEPAPQRGRLGNVTLEDKNEIGVVAGLDASLRLTDRHVFDALGEIAYLWNAGSFPQDRLYFTASGTVIVDDRWEVGLTVSSCDTTTSSPLFQSGVQQIVQLHGGYRFENDIEIKAAFVRLHGENGSNRHGFGLSLSYDTDFSIALAGR